MALDYDIMNGVHAVREDYTHRAPKIEMTLWYATTLMRSLLTDDRHHTKVVDFAGMRDCPKRR